MPLVQDQSLNLLAGSPACYHCTTDASCILMAFSLVCQFLVLQVVFNSKRYSAQAVKMLLVYEESINKHILILFLSYLQHCNHNTVY